ncbi:hypothetical protein N7478_008025 [Penicillium angulare]|uniref:uncharacterized protein n=1 Tax=Penicillium angulare TaxID=116970 RepID=UPI002541B4F7|nr:uncharacterized protein N7478_008025 [Penicillium angulare]KAJ5272900.1 hypothetical protein N7478_008025 [Penicillium angulare]
MPGAARSTGRSAPYGQACLGCFKNKSKCIPRVEGGGCERCYRLKRPCNSADTLRRRNDKKPNPTDVRVAKLEGAIEQLVSLIQAGNSIVDVGGIVSNLYPDATQSDRAEIMSPRQEDLQHNQYQNQQQHQLQQSPSQLQHPENQQSQQELQQTQYYNQEQPQLQHQQSPPHVVQFQNMVGATDDTMGTMENSNADLMEADDHNYHTNTGINTNNINTSKIPSSASWWLMHDTTIFNSNSIALATPPSSTISDPLMSPSVFPSTASICLDNFRSNMLHHFPFIHLSTHLTAHQLSLDRPLLFRAIVCVTSASIQEKKARSFELKRMLSEAMFFQQLSLQEQSQPRYQTVDILLALLVYIAWGWEHLQSRSTLSRLMGMAILLVGELQFLDHEFPETTRTILQLEPKGGLTDAYGNTTANTTHDTYLYFERQRAILGCFAIGSAVSAYFPELDALRWIPQMDKGLSALIVHGAECPSDAALTTQVRLQLLTMKAAQVRERAQLPDHPPPESLSLQDLLYIKGLMGQLQELRASIPPEFQQHFVLLAQTYYTEMCIIQTIHTQESTRPQPPTCGPTRQSCFIQAALAIKSCTSTFLTLSPSGLLGVSFIQWAQQARCIATLYQLGKHQESGWDPATLCKLADLSDVLSNMINKLELAALEAGEQPGSADGTFTQLARGFRMFGQQEDTRTPEEMNNMRQQSQSNIDILPATAPAVTAAGTEVSAYGQQTNYFISPTTWFDQFLIDYQDQTIPSI